MEYCTVRTDEDVDWVVGRVLQGNWVSAHVGGLRWPRRRGLGEMDALCSLEQRLTKTGAVLYTGCGDTAFRRMVRGRSALVVPSEGEGGDAAGVREPRPNPPDAPFDGLQPSGPRILSVVTRSGDLDRIDDGGTFDLSALFVDVGLERTRHGLSLAAMGRQVGVSPSTIRKYESADDAEADGGCSQSCVG